MPKVSRRKEIEPKNKQTKTDKKIEKINETKS